MTEVYISTHKREEMVRFLELHDFEVEKLDENVYKIVRDGELPVYLHQDGEHLYYELDLGSIHEVKNKEELYFNLLSMNTEVLPVSFAVDNTNPADPHLVLVESREMCNLDDNEVLSVFDALELAADRAAEVLVKYTK